jgi:phosphatidylserine/phosphatidylglycerophosphate/cardiolipin synthase-like enzyme
VATNSPFLENHRSTDGNRFEVLVDGADTFWQLLFGILNAKKFIYIATWDFEPGMELTRHKFVKKQSLKLGNPLLEKYFGDLKKLNQLIDEYKLLKDPLLGDVLIKKANEGVEVKVLTFSHVSGAKDISWTTSIVEYYQDALDKIPISTFEKELCAANPKSGIISDSNNYKSPRRKYRTGSQHQKFWVMDYQGEDTVGFLGGINLKQQDWDTSEHLAYDQRRTQPGLNREGVVNKEALESAFKSWLIEKYIIPEKIEEQLSENEEIMKIVDQVVDEDRKEELIENISGLVVEYLKKQEPFGARHDVFCEIWGPATRELIAEFQERWSRAVKNQKKQKYSPSIETEAKKAPVKFRGFTSLRIGNTDPFEKADNEKQIIFKSYLDAIKNARDFIYIENQYFTSEVIAKAIARQMEEYPELQLLIVLPNKAEDAVVGPAIAYRQYRLIKLLRDTADNRSFVKQPIPPEKSRVQVMSLFTMDKEFEPKPIYVHAKVAIIDDIWMTIGSANCSDRSFELDTELNCFLENATLAKSFRQRLWSEHMQLPTAKVEDPLKGLKLIKNYAEFNQKIIDCKIKNIKPKGRFLPLNFKISSPTSMLNPLIETALDYILMVNEQNEFIDQERLQQVPTGIERDEELINTYVMPFLKRDIISFYEKMADEFL